MAASASIVEVLLPVWLQHRVSVRALPDEALVVAMLMPLPLGTRRQAFIEDYSPMPVCCCCCCCSTITTHHEIRSWGMAGCVVVNR
ncbi:uncharacterized protein BCR38DRAFT_447723 [Pseudomassariella vexata]|uniref:Uncharacterized protein n=1 Tax=Pseudomassariella vexata TaxID=1141098 RepID=A0A1Y2DH70_9PEZI|nr:uncharacterized protein BCR38DRAFT_447723 [Pseudomassariella vexata]ORY58588.1 hypothetical protein BCR38DRAFT_447723 [Pseudomassariella vexata]